MKSVGLFVTGCTLLVGCGPTQSTSTVTLNSQTGQAAVTGDIAGVSKALKIRPGKWQLVTKTNGGQIPGVDIPQEMIKKRPPVVSEICLSPAQAAAGPESMLKGGQIDCKDTDSVRIDGRVASTLVCSHPGGTTTMRTVGTFDETTMSVDASFTSTGDGAMTGSSHLDAKFIGECGK